MSDNLLYYGTIEELWNLGCTTKTIANITKQPLCMAVCCNFFVN